MDEKSMEAINENFGRISAWVVLVLLGSGHSGSVLVWLTALVTFLGALVALIKALVKRE